MVDFCSPLLSDSKDSRARSILDRDASEMTGPVPAPRR